MVTPVVSRLEVSLPVVIDFQGALARGVTDHIGLETISFLTDCDTPPSSTVTIVLNFSRNVAYMPLSGHITSVRRELDSDKTFRVDITLSPLGAEERLVLESVFEEVGTYLEILGMPESPERSALREALVTTEPRSILSLFITDNPFPLPYYTGSKQRSTWSQFPESMAPAIPVDGGLAEPAWRPTRFSGIIVREGCWLLLQVFRDLVVRVLPRSLARFLTKPITYAFIAHPRTLGDVPRKFPFAHWLPLHLVERWFRHQWPFVASYITGLKMADGTPTIGAMLIAPLSTEQMIRNPPLARRRVLETVRLAEKMGARIAGLGAFTSIVTRDGRDLNGKVRLGLTTGNPHSAAIAVQNVLHAAALTNLSLPHATVAIVGGAGSVGSACAKLLARLVSTVFVIDIKKDELRSLVTQLADAPAAVKAMSTLDCVQDADVVIAATNNPHILVTAHHLKPGAIVIDAAQPKNVSEEVPLQRPDVLVIDSAVVQTPEVNVNFDLDLRDGEALGCLSETMILTAIGWDGHYSLGKADPQQASHIIAAGRTLGFRLAPFRNSVRRINEEDLRRVARERITLTR